MKKRMERNKRMILKETQRIISILILICMMLISGTILRVRCTFLVRNFIPITFGYIFFHFLRLFCRFPIKLLNCSILNIILNYFIIFRWTEFMYNPTPFFLVNNR